MNIYYTMATKIIAKHFCFPMKRFFFFYQVLHFIFVVANLRSRVRVMINDANIFRPNLLV